MDLKKEAERLEWRNNKQLGRKLFVYCIGPVEGRADVFRFYNREYKPVGLNFDYSPWIDYDEYAVAYKLKGLTKVLKRKLHCGSVERDDGYVYLYNDLTVPWKSKKNLDLYVQKLLCLMKLKSLPVIIKKKGVMNGRNKDF